MIPQRSIVHHKMDGLQKYLLVEILLAVKHVLFDAGVHFIFELCNHFVWFDFDLSVCKL